MSREIISARKMPKAAPMAPPQNNQAEDPSASSFSGNTFKPDDIFKWQPSDQVLEHYLQPAQDKASSMESPQTPDRYPSRLLKYIPTEVVVLFITLDSLVRASVEIPLFVYWGIFLFCLAGTWLYLWRVAKVRKHTQLAISTVAFVGSPWTPVCVHRPQ